MNRLTARPRLESTADRTTVVTMIDIGKQIDYLNKDTACKDLPYSFPYTGMAEDPPKDFTRAAFWGRRR